MKKDVIDILLVVALLASVGLLTFFQLRKEGKLPVAESTGTTTAPSILTETRQPTLISTIAPTRTVLPTQTSTLTSVPTVILRPTFTASPPVLTATLPTNASTLSPVDAEINDGIARGDQIVQAIEAYTQANGFYPSELTALVPNYLTEIPVTISSQPYFYRVFDRTTVMSPEIYWLSFRVTSQENVTCTYYRRLEYWDCNFSSP